MFWTHQKFLSVNINIFIGILIDMELGWIIMYCVCYDISVSNFYCHPDIDLFSTDVHLRQYLSRLILYYCSTCALAEKILSFVQFLLSIPPQFLQ